MDQKVKSFAITALRRMSLRWWARTEAMKRARIERGMYKCAMCTNTFHRKEIQLDHIIPVVSSEGFINFDTFIERLYCQPEGFQVLCEQCHDAKTLLEGNIRTMKRKKKKKA